MKARYKLEIERLYLELYPLLFEYARSSLSSDSLAEEAVQETFRIACQKADVLYKSVNKEGWLLNTLKNVISNIQKIQLRTRRRMEEYASSLASLPQNNDIDFDVLYKDLASTEEYALIKELVLEQKSIRELAESRGISIAACKKRVQRAKQALRKQLIGIDDP